MVSISHFDLIGATTVVAQLHKCHKGNRTDPHVLEACQRAMPWMHVGAPF